MYRSQVLRMIAVRKGIPLPSRPQRAGAAAPPAAVAAAAPAVAESETMPATEDSAAISGLIATEFGTGSS
jgi:hypothetical protein